MKLNHVRRTFKKLYNSHKKRSEKLRYVFWEDNGELYLIDMLSLNFIIGSFIPLFSWLVSHLAMKTSENMIHTSNEKIDNIALKNTNKITLKGVLITAIVIASTRIAINFLFYKVAFESNTFLSIIIVVSGIITFTLVKVHLSKNKKLFFDENQIKVRIVPKSLKSAIELLILTYLILFLILISFQLFIIIDNWISLLFGFFLLWILSLLPRGFLLCNKIVIKKIETIK